MAVDVFNIHHLKNHSESDYNNLSLNMDCAILYGWLQTTCAFIGDTILKLILTYFKYY